MTTLFSEFFLEFLITLWKFYCVETVHITIASKQIIILDIYFVKLLLQLLIKIDINRFFGAEKFYFKEMYHIKLYCY